MYDILEMTSDEVIALSEVLEANGFEYDVDFTTVYGKDWAPCGIRLETSPAIQFAGFIAGDGIVLDGIAALLGATVTLAEGSNNAK